MLQSIDRGVAERRFRQSGRPHTRELRQWIADEMRRGSILKDRFTQRFQRTYGDVWQQTLLVSASPIAVDNIAASVVRRASGQRAARLRTRMSLAGSIAGLAALILVAYVVLNAATKGYYVWVLRLAAGALVVGGAAVLLMVA